MERNFYITDDEIRELFSLIQKYSDNFQKVKSAERMKTTDRIFLLKPVQDSIIDFVNKVIEKNLHKVTQILEVVKNMREKGKSND